MKIVVWRTGKVVHEGNACTGRETVSVFFCYMLLCGLQLQIKPECTA